MSGTRNWPVVGLALLLIVGSGMVAAYVFGGKSAPKWKEFAPPDARFRVLMPGTPADQPQPLGGATAHLYGLKAANGVEYSVMFVELPADMTAPGRAGKTLDDACAAGEQKLNGKIVESTKLELGPNPGREVRIDVPGDRVRRMKVYLSGGRYFQVVAEGPAEAVASPETAAFLDSFTIS